MTMREGSCSPFFDVPDPVADQVSLRAIDPPLLMFDIHEIDHADQSLAICHLFKITDTAIFFLGEPWLYMQPSQDCHR